MSTENASDWLLDDYRSGFATAHGQAICSAKIRSSNADFQVDEQLSFSLSGEGEHLYLRIQKEGLNTEQVVKALAKHFDIAKRDIGYAGLKDRNAITTQWFSVPQPVNSTTAEPQLDVEGLKVIEVMRHLRKLRIGAIQQNKFVLVLRQIEGSQKEIDMRLNGIRDLGVPNYFGEQRFGHEGNNLEKGEALVVDGVKIKSKHLRGLCLSAVRSLVFNRQLSSRILANTWNTAVAGDVLMFDDGNSFFVAEQWDSETQERLTLGKIHPTGILPGSGMRNDSFGLSEKESAQLESFSRLFLGLEALNVAAARRALRLFPRELDWKWLEKDTLQLSFALRPGSYATSVLREVFTVEPALPVFSS